MLRSVKIFMVRQFKQIWEVMKNNYINYCWSLLWTFLILFFAYTVQAISLLYKGSCMTDVHIQTQCSLVAMVINFGIICMIVLDVKQDRDFRKDAFQWVIYSFVIIILMHVHANIPDKTSLKFCFHNPLIGLLLAGIFILLATQLKFLSKNRIERIESSNEVSNTKPI